MFFLLEEMMTDVEHPVDNLYIQGNVLGVRIFFSVVSISVIDLFFFMVNLC